MAPKENFKTQVDPELRRAFDEFLERNGMTLTSGTEKLLAWFCSQDDLVQSAVMGQVSPSKGVDKLLVQRTKFLGDVELVRKQAKEAAKLAQRIERDRG